MKKGVHKSMQIGLGTNYSSKKYIWGQVYLSLGDI